MNWRRIGDGGGRNLEGSVGKQVNAIGVKEDFWLFDLRLGGVLGRGRRACGRHLGRAEEIRRKQAKREKEGGQSEEDEEEPGLF